MAQQSAIHAGQPPDGPSRQQLEDTIAVCSRLGGSWSQASLQPMLDLFLTCEALEIEPLSTAVIDIEEITSILQKVTTFIVCCALDDHTQKLCESSQDSAARAISALQAAFCLLAQAAKPVFHLGTSLQNLTEQGRLTARTSLGSTAVSFIKAAAVALNSERWLAICGLDTFQQVAQSMQDTLKQQIVPGMTPIIQSTSDGPELQDGLCKVFEELLSIGTQAAQHTVSSSQELVRNLRSYSALNTAWTALSVLLSAAPAQLLGTALMGSMASRAVRVLGSNAYHHAQAVVAQPHARGLKVAQFWVQHLSRMLHMFPLLQLPGPVQDLWPALAGTVACLHSLRHQKQEQVHADAQPVVSRLQSSISTSLCDADPSMAYLTQLEDQIPRLLDAAHSSDDQNTGIGTLLLMLQLLSDSASHTHPSVRQSLARALLPNLLIHHPACPQQEVQQQPLRQQTEQAVLSFMATCCRDSMHGPDSSEAWHECQRCLFRSALEVHPLHLQHLSSVWCQILRLASPELAEAYVRMLLYMTCHLAAALSKQGLQLAPAAEMLVQQLACLTGHLLSASPAAVQAVVSQHFLEELTKPQQHSSRAALARLGAIIRIMSSWQSDASEECRDCVQNSIDQLGLTLLHNVQIYAMEDVAVAHAQLACAAQAIQCSSASYESCASEARHASRQAIDILDRLQQLPAPSADVAAAYGAALHCACGLWQRTGASAASDKLLALVQTRADMLLAHEVARHACTLARLSIGASPAPVKLLHTLLQCEDWVVRYEAMEALCCCMRSGSSTDLQCLVPASLYSPDDNASQDDAPFLQLVKQHYERESTGPTPKAGIEPEVVRPLPALQQLAGSHGPDQGRLEQALQVALQALGSMQAEIVPRDDLTAQASQKLLHGLENIHRTSKMLIDCLRT